MKYHLLLTGPPRVGKTTLIEKAVHNLKTKFIIDGFITKEIREQGERIGFEILGIKGERKILSHKDFKSPYRVGKYRVNLKNLEDIIEKIESKNCDILVIDEIGKMELLSRKFFAWAMNSLTVEKPRVLGTVGERVFKNLERENNFSKCRITKVSYKNRNSLLQEILNFYL